MTRCGCPIDVAAAVGATVLAAVGATVAEAAMIGVLAVVLATGSIP